MVLIKLHEHQSKTPATVCRLQASHVLSQRRQPHACQHRIEAYKRQALKQCGVVVRLHWKI